MPKQRKHRIEVVADAQTLAERAAAEFLSAAKQAVRTKGRFTVALTGGSTPKPLYSLLANDPKLRTEVPWGKILFFFGDERRVPRDHPDSNYRMASETMLSRAPIDESQIFRMKGEYRQATKAAAEYSQILRKTFHLAGRQLPRFDLILLGMGPEGHVASLFPGTKALHESRRLVAANWVGKLYTDRITLTAPVLNNAARIIFLIAGEEKALVLKGVVEGPYEPEQLPAQIIRPRNGTVLWLIDQKAGALLTGTSQAKS